MWSKSKNRIHSHYERSILLGIGKMLQMLGLTFDGRSHSGLDDSINIARIALELIQVRFFFDRNKILDLDV